jgi:hypothetical protein
MKGRERRPLPANMMTALSALAEDAGSTLRPSSVSTAGHRAGAAGGPAGVQGLPPTPQK